MKNSKIITMIVSLLAAVLLWLYVVTVVNPDGDMTISNIPVTFSGVEVLREDQKLTITNVYDESVTVHFYGKNADLKKLEENRDEIQAVVDVSKVRSSREYSLSYELTLPNSIQKSAIEIANRKPSNIAFGVERIISKPVEVRCDLSSVEIADGYVLDNTELDYESVTVEGPESAVNAIDHAQVTLNRTNVDKSIREEAEYELLDADGNAVDRQNLSVDTETIEVSLNVLMYKVVPLEVKFIDGGGASAEDVSCRIEPETVTLSGDATVLSSVNTIVLANVDLADTDNSATLTYPIMIPNDAKNVSGEEEAVVTIKIKNKLTDVIRTTNIVFDNLSEGLEATSVTQQAAITVRSSEQDLKSIAANHVRLVADMSEYVQPGTYQVPVTVNIDGHSEAGVIGDYSIAVTVKLKEKDEK